jgi:hypothetical protein
MEVYLVEAGVSKVRLSSYCYTWYRYTGEAGDKQISVDLLSVYSLEEALASLLSKSPKIAPSDPSGYCK